MKLGGSPDTADAEFHEQSTLINLFQEPSTQRVGDLEDSAEYVLCQRIESVFIGVTRRPMNVPS
jgi:hypothetical protein